MRLACLILFIPIIGFCQNADNNAEVGSVTSRSTKFPPAIGSVLPSIQTRNVLNHSSDIIDLSDYQNRLVILDFMQTSCISCLHKLPLLDSLQKRYKDRLKIILVTREPEERVKAFITKSKLGKSLSLPWVAADTALSDLFPYQFISHLVWIRNNKVVTITSSSYISGKNIELALHNDVLPWPVKNDFAPFDYEQPLLSLLPKQPSQYSLVYKHQQNIPPRSGWGRVEGGRRFYAVNYTLLELYRKAFGLPKNFAATRILLDVNNKEQFFYPGNTNKTEWFMQNSYCYESVLSLQNDRSYAMQKLRKDLDDYFNIQSSLDNKKMTCLLLKQGTVDTTVLCSRTDIPPKSRGWQAIALIVERMNQLPQSLPVIDDTGFGNERFLQLPEEVLDNPEMTREYLCSLGFEFIMGVREMPVLIIHENRSNEKR